MDKLLNGNSDFLKELVGYSLGIVLTVLMILPFI